jgi:hypothetical protein
MITLSEPMLRHFSRSEIIEIAAAEGHNADIPSNTGSLSQIHGNSPSHKSEKPSSAIEKDIEKGAREKSISSEEGIEEMIEYNPDIVFWVSMLGIELLKLRLC